LCIYFFIKENRYVFQSILSFFFNSKGKKKVNLTETQEDKDIKEKTEVRNLLYATIAISDI
jgi:hypothetical protein